MVVVSRRFCIGFNTCGFSHDNPDYFVTSQWQKGSKSVFYLIYRWLLALYFLGIVINSMIFSTSLGLLGYYFIYMTNWGIWMCMITTFIGAVLVTAHHFDWIKTGSEMPFLFKAYWFLSNATTVLAVVITVVYWSVLFDGTDKGVNTFLTHAANAAGMLFDLLIVRYPIFLYHIIYSINIGIFYLLFTVVYYFAGGEDGKGNRFVYPVLDWSKPGPALITTAGTIVLGILAHFFIFLIQEGRTRLHSKLYSKKMFTINV